MVRDRAKMNLAGHRVRRLSGNYFEPCVETSLEMIEPANNVLIWFAYADFVKMQSKSFHDWRAEVSTLPYLAN